MAQLSKTQQRIIDYLAENRYIIVSYEDRYTYWERPTMFIGRKTAQAMSAARLIHYDTASVLVLTDRYRGSYSRISVDAYYLTIP